MFSDHNAIKLAVNKKLQKAPIWGKKLLNNLWIEEEIIKELQKCLELSNNYMQNLWDTAKSVNRRKYIAVNTFIRKEERLKNKWSKHSTQEVRKCRGTNP